MARLLKVILYGAYSALLVQCLKTILFKNTVEVVEIRYYFDRRSYSKTVSAVNISVYEPLVRLPTDYKYILRWSKGFTTYSTPALMNGQKTFLLSNCTFKNCYLTNNMLLLSDVRDFDAILFDIENYWDVHPIARSPHQKFVFVGTESAQHFPVCFQTHENYYNLTWTYKLDSDIPWSYVKVLDKNEAIVGPKIGMEWIDPMLPTPDSVRRILQGKNKTAAWFVSTCQTESNRLNVTESIKRALMKYGLKIDVYGWCGPLRCPKDRLEDCMELLQREYYFYLSFENSLHEDYVTEKILHPLLHYTVPIVYGGADYSRFLPPGSYLDAKKYDAETIAFQMNEAIKHPKIYQDYFKWHNHYTYAKNPNEKDVCNLCEEINKPGTFTPKKNFRKWWNKDYETLCKAVLEYSNWRKPWSVYKANYQPPTTKIVPE